MEYGVCIVELDMLSKSHSPKGALNLNTLGPPTQDPHRKQFMRTGEAMLVKYIQSLHC